MSAAAFSINVEQGSDSEIIIKSNNTDLTGATAIMQARQKLDTAPIFELSTDNLKLVIENGNLLRIKISKADSFLLQGDAEYDLFVTLGAGPKAGTTIKLLRGKIKLIPAVTR